MYHGHVLPIAQPVAKVASVGDGVARVLTSVKLQTSEKQRVGVRREATFSVEEAGQGCTVFPAPDFLKTNG